MSEKQARHTSDTCMYPGACRECAPPRDTTEAEILAQPCVQEALKKAREAERAIWSEAWDCVRDAILDKCVPMRADFDNDDVNAVLAILDDAKPTNVFGDVPDAG